MAKQQTWLLGSIGSLGLASMLGLLACGAQSAARCDPNVEMCAASGGSSTSSSTSTGTGGTPGRTFTKRIVAYLPIWNGSLRNWALDMPWYRVSQVNIAFAVPSGSTLTLNPAMPGAGQDLYLGQFVTAAHAAGVKVLVSMGGAGTGSTQVATQYAPGTVDAFVSNITAYIAAQNLDGIDVDVEGGSVNANYGPFIDKLVAKLRPGGKLVTAALAQWFGNSVPDATYGQFDSINVMSYDHCTRPATACATYDSAVTELNFFSGKGLTTDKILLGVPFYCHCWGPACLGQTAACTTGAGCQIAYGQVNVAFPGGMDTVVSNGTTYSCNGPATIQQKADLSRGYAGMMLWEITQDAGGDQSLLKVMADNL